MKELAGLKDLKALDVRQTKVTSDGLKGLVVLKALTELTIERKMLTDDLAAAYHRAGMLQVLHWGDQRRNQQEGGKRSRRGMAMAFQALGKAMFGGLIDLLEGDNKNPLERCVDLSDTKITDKGFAEFAADVTLQSVNLSNTQVTDESLNSLAKLPELQIVKLKSTRVTTEGVKKLAGLKKLHTLQIDREIVTDGLVKAFREAGLLHALHATLDPLYASAGSFVLSLSGDYSGQVPYKRPTSMAEMLRLSLEKTQITDDGLKEFADCRKLHVLDLRQSKTSNACVKHIVSFQELRILDLRDTKVEAATLKNLAGLHKLHTICLERGNITDDVLLALNEADLLHALAMDVSFGLLTEPQAPPAANDAVHLDLSGTQITDRGLQQLSSLKNLQSLLLESTDITDAGLRHLAGLGKLRSLDLRRSKVTDAGLKHLARLSELRDLSLSYTATTDAGIRELTGLKKLQCLLLTGAPVTDASMKIVGQLHDLEILDLSGTKIGDAGLKNLGGLKKLKALLLQETSLTDRGLKELPGRDSLRRLDLTQTGITDAGLKELLGLKLQSLAIDRSIITDKALTYLRQAGMLDCFDTGTSFGSFKTSVFPRPEWPETHDLWLNLSGTKITDRGLHELVGLERTEIDLSRTNITDEGLKTLALMPEVGRFNLTDTKVTQGGVNQLRLALPRCEIRCDTHGDRQ